MHSLYRKQLAMMVSIVALSFTLLSAAFMLLTYRYLIQETRESVQRNAGYISTFTNTYYQQNRTIQNTFYSSYVASIALISDAHIIVANPDGEIIYATDGSNFYTYENNYLSQSLVTQVMENGSYSGLTNLDGLYPERRYLTALPVAAELGERTLVRGMVLVAADASNLTGMWLDTATIFFFSAVVVLLIAVVASTLTSARQTRPLNEMAEAARKFEIGRAHV